MGVSLYWELTQGVIPVHRPSCWLALYGYLQQFLVSTLMTRLSPPLQLAPLACATCLQLGLCAHGSPYTLLAQALPSRLVLGTCGSGLVSPPGVTVNLPSIWGWSNEAECTVCTCSLGFALAARAYMLTALGFALTTRDLPSWLVLRTLSLGFAVAACATHSRLGVRPCPRWQWQLAGSTAAAAAVSSVLVVQRRRAWPWQPPPLPCCHRAPPWWR